MNKSSRIYASTKVLLGLVFLGAMASCQDDVVFNSTRQKNPGSGIDLTGSVKVTAQAKASVNEPRRIKLIDAAIYFKFAKDALNNDRVIGDRSNPPAGYLEEEGTAFWLPQDTAYTFGGPVHPSLKLLRITRNDFAEGLHFYTDDAAEAERTLNYGAMHVLWSFLFNSDANGGSPLYRFRCDWVGRYTIGFEPAKHAPYGCKVDKILGYVLRK